MLPKRINKDEDKKIISGLLEEFYRNPDKKYGIRDNDKATFGPYADFISTWVTARSKILDVGSGGWRLPELISKKDYDVIGCDFFAEEASGKSDRNYPGSYARLVCGSGYALPFKSESFDAVTTLAVLEHVAFADKFLREMNRVLKPNGLLILCCPNWAGLNAPVRAMASLALKKKSYWQYDNIPDALLGAFRSIFWYLEILFSRGYGFIYVYPKIRENKIWFEESDDDCVHLCQPLSIKKWLKINRYSVIKYNRMLGNSHFGRIFNTLFPSFATINNIVARKSAIGV